MTMLSQARARTHSYNTIPLNMRTKQRLLIRKPATTSSSVKLASKAYDQMMNRHAEAVGLGRCEATAEAIF